jgi:sugar transferase (PEP-CTERM/EpsH1 system associated)
MGDILFLAHRAPYPPDRGDKIRAFHILKHLAARRRVHLAAFADDLRDLRAKSGLYPLLASRAIVMRRKSTLRAVAEAFASRRPASVSAFADTAMAHAVADVLAREPIETIYVFSSQMAQYLPATGQARVVMDFVDVDSAKFADYAAAGGLKAAVYAREARLLLAHDRAVAERADASLFVSEAETALFRARTGAARVHAVENGIDTAAFDPLARFEAVRIDGPLIVFTGQMDYPPNIAAVRWFADAILPAIRAHHATARFAIVGRAPTADVRALASDAVIVTGEVPDVRGWLAAASVVVAPLKIARGIQNKVLEAMAMARPVVASAPAAEGIDHGATLRTGGDAAQLAAAVTALLDDPAAADALGQAARARVIARYGWDARLAPLDALLGFTSARQVAA